MVPVGDYELPLGKAEVLTQGTDLTVVGWGAQLYVLENAIQLAQKKMPGLSVELIDLRSILPWDVETVCNSVNKTGRLLIAHEAPKTQGFAAEIATTVMERYDAIHTIRTERNRLDYIAVCMLYTSRL